jgi:DNA polymerase-3 subunit delta
MSKEMIIFLYGKDTYRLNQKEKEIIQEYKKIHKSGLNLISLGGKEIAFQELKDQFQQTSMFKEKKLLLLKDIFSNKDFKEKFKKEIKKLISSEDIILIVEKGAISANDSLLKVLKKKAKWQEFKLLGGEKLKAWLEKEFGKYKTRIKPDALGKLIEFLGNDLWRLSNEVKKLVNFKGIGSEIEIGDVELLVKPKIETDIFKTIDFIAKNNKKKAFELLKEHLEKGDSPLYLLSMINFQFRNLLIIRDLIDKNIPPYLISRKTKLHPYVVKKSYPLAKKFELSELKKIYQKIFEVDLNIKTGKIEPETGLDLLIAQI